MMGKIKGNAAKATAGSAGPARGPAKELYRLTDLAQMKVLSNPLRIRILELLCEERTTKQVAGVLGLPPTRLYHHVAALERVGLIRLARTRQARGALEKYYVAVAKAFTADPRIFASERAAQATQHMAVQMLDNTSAELRALLDSGQSLEGLQREGILGYLEVRGTSKELATIRGRLTKLLEDCTGASGKRPAKGAAGECACRLTIAFFPLAGRSSST